LDSVAEGEVRLRGPYAFGAPHRPAPIDLAFLMGALRRQARLIALVVAGGLIATLLVLFLITPRYVAIASILIDTQSATPPGSRDSEAKSDVIIEDEVEILRSPRIAARVLSQLESSGAEEGSIRSSSWWPSFFASKPEGIQIANASPGDGRQTTDAATIPANAPNKISLSAFNALMRYVDIQRKGHSFVVAVSYIDPSGDRAAAVANAFVEAYLADQLQTKLDAARGENRSLKARILDVRKDINSVEQRQQAYRASQGLIEVGGLTLMQKEISDYAEQLASARARAAEAVARLNQAKSLAENPQQLLSLDTALQSTVISEYRRQAAEIQRRIADNVSRYGDQHASSVSAKAELINLNIEIQNEIKRIVESLQLSSDSAAGKVKLLEDGLAKLKENALAFQGDQTKLSEFTRDLDVSTKLYATLLARYHETGAEALLRPDARVLSYAVAPTRPSSPKKTLLLLLASVAWLGVGAGLGLMRELTHRPLRSRAEVERALGLPCVVEIPVVDLTIDEGTEVSAHNLCTPVYWKLPEEDGGRFNQAIFVLRQWTQSSSARPARVIVVAATHIGEGCSTVAAQLARYAASAGLRTVLVDADLRARGLSDALGAEPSTSPGKSEPGAAAQFPPAIRLQDGLDFCAAAPSNCRPLDVLGSEAMGAFLDKLRDDHELIVIDTPALATYVDAAALVEHADALLLVVKSAQTDQQDVIDALTRLDADPQLPIGVVLNMAG
jgi:uncharacterized protein involved in exopolysaccharide biosynthesis/Mrp family chromosome partitioning ATPase